jgi:hypothetical protein
MRRLYAFFFFLALASAPVLAQTSAPSPDSKPPEMIPLDDSIQPEVTIRKREGETVEEHRVNGKLYKVIVTPEHGVPYVLVDQTGDGSFVALDGPGGPQISVPMWVIGRF